MEKLAAQANIHGAPILSNAKLILAAVLQACLGAMLLINVMTIAAAKTVVIVL